MEEKQANSKGTESQHRVKMETIVEESKNVEGIIDTGYDSN